MTKKSFTIGTDPEFFLTRSGKIISSIPHVDGTKEAPKMLPSGGNIQRDNVAVEIATKPAETVGDFINAIEATLKEAVATLPTNSEIIALPSAVVDDKELEHPEAQKFGCDPDFDAWRFAINDAPCLMGADENLRSCGAHIHVGTSGNDANAFLSELDGKILMVKTMDCLHGIMSTILDNSEASIERRKLYGKAGAHRPKPYGVEYRVLSNYWLRSPVLVSMIYSLTEDALALVRDGKAQSLIDKISEEEVCRIINTGDIASATKIMDLHLAEVISKESLELFEIAKGMLNNDIDMYKEWGMAR